MRKLNQVLLLAVLLALGWGVYRLAFPDHARRIRSVLAEAASAASWSESTGALDKLAAAGRLAGLCTEDVDIRLDAGGGRVIQGRSSVREAALAARQQLGSLRVRLVESQVNLDPGTATAEVQAILMIQAGAGREFAAQEVVLQMRREGRAWRIARLEPVRGFGSGS